MSDTFGSLHVAAIEFPDREQSPVKDRCSAAALITKFPANRARWTNGSPGINRCWVTAAAMKDTDRLLITMPKRGSS